MLVCLCLCMLAYVCARLYTHVCMFVSLYSSVCLCAGPALALVLLGKSPGPPNFRGRQIYGIQKCRPPNLGSPQEKKVVRTLVTDKAVLQKVNLSNKKKVVKTLMT